MGVIIKIHIFQDDLPEDLEIKGDIAIDTEAMGLNIQRDKLCLVQLCDESGAIYLIQFINQNYSAPVLKSLFLDTKRTKIFHFARFDLSIMERYLDIQLQNIFCTKIASKLVRTYTESHGLKDLCKEILGIQISKQQQSSDWGATVLSRDQQEYAARDVIHLHQLRDKLTEMLKREDRMDIATKLFQFVPTRAHLDVLGWAENDIFAH